MAGLVEFSKAVGIQKAWKGEQGDKRNTKYLGAAYGGAVLGANAGSLAGARAAGTTRGAVRRGVKAYGASLDPVALAGRQGDPKNLREGFKAARGIHREIISGAKNAVPGASAAFRGGKIGAATGALAATGGYAAYRHNKRK